MRIRTAILSIAVLCGCLFPAVPANAQLTREWTYDPTTLGYLPYSYTLKPIIVDDSGNTYILSILPGLTETRITKLRSDSTVDWQTVAADSGLVLDFFTRTANGDLYIAGHHEREGGWTTWLAAMKLSAAGSPIWSRSLTAPSPNSFGWNDPRCAVDHLGNLWIGISESTVDSICPDSTDGFGTLSQAVLHRLVAATGEPTEIDRIELPPWQSSFIYEVQASQDGYVNVSTGLGYLCCNDFCGGCLDSCFTDYRGSPIGYRADWYLRRYTSGGAFSGSTFLAATDNAFFSVDLFTSRDGDLMTAIKQYASPPPYWTHLSQYGQWNISFPGEIVSGDRFLFDYGGYLYTIVLVDEHTDAMAVQLVDCATGSVLWTRDLGWGAIGVDRDGNLLLKDNSNLVRSYDRGGNERWTFNPGYNIGDFLYADTSGNLYYYYYKALRKFSTTKELVIRDHWGDSLAHKQFDLIRVADDRPVFTEDTLGRITTDGNGRFAMSFVTSSTYEVALYNGDKDTLAVGEAVKIARVLDNSAAVKHTGVLGTMYSLHLDNMAIDSFSTVSFDTLTDESEQDIHLTHTEVRYNLLVSLDWDADQAYLEGLQESFRRMSNYLYDVTDGQLRLDTVVIYDDRYLWDQADVWIHAKNDLHPCAFVRGIDDPAPKTIMLPRRWFGNEQDCRNFSYDEHPLVLEYSTVYRTTAHELGHYALGYYDEYLFSAGERCPLIGNYGFMDYQYADGGVYASELSSSFRYTDAACRNTEQYTNNHRCCWDQFEARFERRYGADDILSCIITPDDDERELYPGDDYLEGPNDYVDDTLFLDYNVGRQVIFPVTPMPPSPEVKTLNLQVTDALSGLPAAGIDVSLRKGGFGLTLRDIPQGGASDLGLIYVLGAEDGDQVLVVGRVDTLGTEKSASRYAWSYGEATVGSTGVSRLGNRFALSLQEDTVLIETQAVQGDYPLIFQPSLASEVTTFAAAYQTPFASLPSVEVRPDGGTAINYTMSVDGATYAADVIDTLGRRGSFLLWGIDDAAHVFPATADYVVSDSGRHLIGPDGTVEVVLDSASAIDRALVVSSSYPPLRTGLPDDAVQAGEVHSVSVMPTGAAANATMLIRYDDADLMVSAGLRGDESSLRIFRWDGSQWTQVGGQPDTAQNTVYGQIADDGVYAAFTTAAVLGIDDDPSADPLPYRFELSQNFPNPFNPVTMIEYSLPARSHVTIEVINILGQRVRTLVNESKSAGTHHIEWDATDDAGKPLSTGLYLYRFQAGEHVETRKMLLLK